MAHRTNTTHQTVFHHPNQGVTLDFVDQKKIKFTLAIASGWRSPYHWHLLHNGCSRIDCLQGRMLVSFQTACVGSGSYSSGPGGYFIFRPGVLHVWRSKEPDQELIVLLETEDEVLYRNTSSAVLDAALFPSLPSTPFWVRLLYSSLAFSPATQRLMIARFALELAADDVLMILTIARLPWIQLQVMYFAHDFRMYHGSIGAIYLWHLAHPFSVERPPKWVFKIEWWSVSIISIATHSVCYWLGRLFLGMKAEYLEYTPGDPGATSRKAGMLSGPAPSLRQQSLPSTK